jgi:hypothetical protein
MICRFDSTALRLRRQKDSECKESLLTRKTVKVAARSTSWTFYGQGTYWEKFLQITVASDSLLTPGLIHVNNLRPCFIASLRPFVPVTIPQGDDEDFDVSHIPYVSVKSLHGRRGKYLLFMTHFSDNDVPPIRHRLNEVHRTMALQISWIRPDGMRLTRPTRTSTSCTLTQRAFLSPSNCFNKGA